ncbi:MAG: hypothetical protein D6706_20310 [Chloroflexi bacterium]|nr:MAG: hypothetical protein D6706_20310 [Chloroflexota bacterium]
MFLPKHHQIENEYYVTTKDIIKVLSPVTGRNVSRQWVNQMAQVDGWRRYQFNKRVVYWLRDDVVKSIRKRYNYRVG